MISLHKINSCKEMHTMAYFHSFYSSSINISLVFLIPEDSCMLMYTVIHIFLGGGGGEGGGRAWKNQQF